MVLVGLLHRVIQLIARILQAFRQRHHIGVVHITRTRSAGNKIIRGAAIECHLLHGSVQGQRLVVVLQQHHTLHSRLPRDLGMGFEIRMVGILIAVPARGFLNKLQDTPDIAVEVFLVEAVRLQTVHDVCKLLILAGLQHIVTCPHLLGTVLAAKPVGHHGSLVAPLVTENRRKQFLALRGILPVEVVVRRHHRPGVTLLHGNLERLQVNLTERPLTDTRIVGHAVRLLIVGSEVLDARAYPIRLYTAHIGSSRLTCHQRVLAVVFKVTAVEGITVNVKSRSQQHVCPIFLHLLSDALAHFFHERLVPGACQ